MIEYKLGNAHIEGDLILKDGVPMTIEEILSELKDKKEYDIRYWLWRTHNPSHYLYGDDGEYQCNTCGIDFLRWDEKKIAEKLDENYTKWLVEHADEINAVTDPLVNVVKFTTHEGKIFYSDNISQVTIHDFWDRLNKRYTKEDIEKIVKTGSLAQTDFILMKKSEYDKIPATNKSYEAFK